MSSASRDQASARHTRTAFRRPRSLLLTTTALASGIVAGVTINPRAAEASCAVLGAGIVVCSTTTTTNTTFVAITPSNDRDYQFAVPTSATVLSGATVDGFGLRFATTAGALTATNDGTIRLTDPGANGQPVLNLVGGGGTLTYNGNGVITNTATTPGSDGLVVTNLPGGNIAINNSAPITGFNGVHATVHGTGEIHITNSSTITGTLNDGLIRPWRGGSVKHDYEYWDDPKLGQRFRHWCGQQ